MKKRLITMSLISGTAMLTGLGIIYPDLYVGIASMMMGGISLALSLNVLKEYAKRRIDKIILESLK